MSKISYPKYYKVEQGKLIPIKLGEFRKLLLTIGYSHQLTKYSKMIPNLG